MDAAREKQIYLGALGSGVFFGAAAAGMAVLGHQRTSLALIGSSLALTPLTEHLRMRRQNTAQRKGTKQARAGLDNATKKLNAATEAADRIGFDQLARQMTELNTEEFAAYANEFRREVRMLRLQMDAAARAEDAGC